MFRLKNIWCSFSPKLTRERSPNLLNSLHKRPYLIESYESLAIGGIYDEEELTNMRDQIMTANERIPMTNIIMRVREATVQHPDYQGISIGNVINENILDQIKQGIVKRTWGYFSQLENIVSSLTGVYVLYQIVKGFFSILIQGRLLYNTFGVSPNLIMGALWNPVANYLVMRRLQQTQPNVQYTPKPQPNNARSRRSDEEQNLIINQLSDAKSHHPLYFNFAPSNKY